MNLFLWFALIEVGAAGINVPFLSHSFNFAVFFFSLVLAAVYLGLGLAERERSR